MLDDRAADASRGAATVRALQLGQHALFVLLVLICGVRAVQDGTPWAAQLLGSAALVGWYGYGVVLARRRSTVAGRVWLALLVLGWVGLVALSPENVWLAFSLWLLAGHLLPLAAAIPVSLLVLSVVVLAPLRHDQLSFAAVIGPSVGMLIALGVARAQGRLVRDAQERQQLISSLVAAQDETAALTDELAESQRTAGRLAERARLSRDIHDTLAQDLVSIVLLSRTGDAAVLPQVERLASEGLEEARRLVAELAPTGLDDGLAGAVRRLLARLQDETGIDAELRLDGPTDGLPTVVEVALLRTLQGALANVRQHSGAQRVVVSLTAIPGPPGRTVRLDVVDDGRGFDVDRETGEGVGPPLRGGYGLRATRDRLRELHGELQVASSPGDGTALSASVPLPDVTPEEER